MQKNIDVILEKLRELGATSVDIYFDGSGDSGSIGYIKVMQADKEITKLTCSVPYDKKTSTYVDGQWIERIQTKNISLNEALTKYCEDALDEENVDWYNNDGGFGNLTIDFSRTPPEVLLEVNLRHTEIETEVYCLHGDDPQDDDDER